MIAPGGNSKTAVRKFAARLRIPLPAILQEQETIENINLRPSTVLKPEEFCSERGIFVDENLELVSFSSRHRYSSADEALSEVKSEKLKKLPNWELE